MEAYYFIYTRILTEDYQALYFPSDIQCPREDFYRLMDLARGVINTDVYSPQLDKPIWLLARQNDYTLWGMGILNKILNPEYAHDYVGCQIRGFYGLIFKGNPQQLPYDVNFFKHIYDLLIVPNWNADANNCFHEGVVCEEDFSTYVTISAKDKSILLNTSSNRSLIIGNVDVEDVISQTMYDNTGIVVGLKDEAHAFSDKYKYPNVWMEGHERAEHIYPVESVSFDTYNNCFTQQNNPWVDRDSTDVQETRINSEFQGGGERQLKKVLGSRIVKVFIVLLASFLGVLCLMKACQENKLILASQAVIEEEEDSVIIQ